MPKYIANNYKNQLKETLKESIFNTLKGDADQIPIPEGTTVVDGESITTFKPLESTLVEPLEVLSEELANIIDEYVTERIYLEIIGYGIDDGRFTVAGSLVDKLKNAE